MSDRRAIRAIAEAIAEGVVLGAAVNTEQLLAIEWLELDDGVTAELGAATEAPEGDCLP